MPIRVPSGQLCGNVQEYKSRDTVPLILSAWSCAQIFCQIHVRNYCQHELRVRLSTIPQNRESPLHFLLQLRVGGANFKEDGHSWDSIWCTCEKVGLTIIGGDRAHQQLNCILRIDDDLSKQLTNQIRLAMQAGHNSLLHKARADKSLRKKSFEFGVKFCGFANNL